MDSYGRCNVSLLKCNRLTETNHICLASSALLSGISLQSLATGPSLHSKRPGSDLFHHPCLDVHLLVPGCAIGLVRRVGHEGWEDRRLEAILVEEARSIVLCWSLRYLRCFGTTQRWSI